MRTVKLLLFTSSIISIMTSPVSAATGKGDNPDANEKVGYFLPKTMVTVVVSQRLAKCPVGGKGQIVVTQTSIVPTAVADKFISIDTRSGALANRSTKISMRANGTIEAFNATVEGQGGQILGAIAKLAFSLAGMAVGAPLPLGAQNMEPSPAGLLECNDDVSGILAALQKKNEQIAAVEARIAEKGANDADLPFLERLQAQAGRLRTALTLSTSDTYDPKATADFVLSPVAFSRWFNRAPKIEEVYGSEGFQVKSATENSYPSHSKASNHEGKTPDNGAQQSKGIDAEQETVSSDLIYRRPVPVTITVVPCKAKMQPNSCKPFDVTDIDAKDMTTKGVVPAAQFSKDYVLKVGRGGLFGSREAVAKFDEFGAPLQLDYGTKSGAADIAGLVDTVREGAQTIRDAELGELERQIKIEKARQELADLRAPDVDQS